MLLPPFRTVELRFVATDELLLGLAEGVVPEPVGEPVGPEVLGEAVLAGVAVVRLTWGPVGDLQTRVALRVRREKGSHCNSGEKDNCNEWL